MAIRHGGDVVLTASDTLGTLLLAEGSTLSSGAHTLNVQGDVELAPTTGPGAAQLTVPVAGVFSARNIAVTGATLQVAGGQVVAPQGDLVNDGRVEGRGTIRIGKKLINNGRIVADGATLLIDETFPGATVDLDGTFSTGVVEALTGSLDVRADLERIGATPAFFSGTMSVGPGRLIKVKDPLRQQNGTITLDGSPSLAAEFRGTELIVRSDVLVDRLAIIDADVELSGNGLIEVPDPSDHLTFRQAVEIDGSDITGLGDLVFEGELTSVSGEIEVGDIELQDDTVILAGLIDGAEIDASQGG